MEPSRRKTTTIETTGGPGDPVRALLRKRMAGFMRMNPEAYCLTYWETMADNPEARLILYKRASGIASKIAEVNPGEHDPADVETWIMSEWGDGAYQFQPEVAGKLYGPASKVFRFGEITDEGPRRVEQDTIDAEISAVTKRLGHVATIGKLAEVADDIERRRKGDAEKGDDEMKPEAMAAMIQAQMAPVLKMLELSEQRAAKAEDRLEKMLDRVMEDRRTVAAGSTPLFAEILKSAVGKPETLSLLLGGNPPPESTWLDTIRELAREFGPVLQAMLAQVMERNAIQALPGGGPGGAPVQPRLRPVPRPGAHDGGPRPTAAPSDTGDGTMPMQLNEEQQMAKDNLVEFIRANDFDNAFAALEAFPGLMPVPGGAVPLGEFIISKIDPKVNARIYLPQLAMLIPEFRTIQAQALAFIQSVQQRILADDEAARREAGRGGAATGAVDDLRPTGGPHDHQ